MTRERAILNLQCANRILEAVTNENNLLTSEETHNLSSCLNRLKKVIRAWDNSTLIIEKRKK